MLYKLLGILLILAGFITNDRFLMIFGLQFITIVELRLLKDLLQTKKKK